MTTKHNHPYKEKLVEFIRDLYPNKEFIGLHEPYLDIDSENAVKNCIKSQFVSSVGPEVSQLEDGLKNYTHSPHVIATNTGTSALHLSLIASGVESGDEVLTQSLSFIATTNAIAYCHASPIFIDIQADTFSLCPLALQRFLNENCYIDKFDRCRNKVTGNKIPSCILMHTFGHIGQVNEISLICKQWKISLIEDAAEAVGSFLDNQHAGTFGDFGIVSFNGNKIITGGNGGAVFCKDPEKATFIKHLSTTAKLPHPFHFTHDQVGFNYRLSSLNASLINSQLKNINFILNQKAKLHNAYLGFFHEYNQVIVDVKYPARDNFWLNTLITENPFELIKYLNKNEIQARPVWSPNHQQVMYQNSAHDSMIQTNKFSNLIVNLPSSVGVKL